MPIALVPAAGALASFPLVTGGRAAPIVIARSAPPQLHEAVGDLVDHIEVCTGVRPRLLTVDGDSTAYDAPAVVVGAAAGLDVTEAAAGYDGYRIVVTRRLARVAGPAPAGTANAIYDLLAAALGVRFLVPGEDGVVAPRRSQVLIAEVDRLERPAFALRAAWYNDNVRGDYPPERIDELKRFVRRNRGGGLRAVIGHYFDRLVPPARHFDDHPEYFAEVQGKRIPHGQLCTTAPGVVRLAAEHWRRRFERDPGLRIGSLSPNDGGLFCTGARCRLAAPTLEDRIASFMNEVTRRVASRHPDRRLAFYAYGPLVEPPSVTLHPNLVPAVTRYQVCQAHDIESPACRTNRQFRRRLDRWGELSRDLLVRDYACWWHAPDLAIDVLANNLRAYARRGVLGVSREYLARGFGSDLMRYLDLRLMWDPREDPERLVDDFLTARFGPAAPGIRRVIDAFRTRLESVDPAQQVYGTDGEIFKVYDTGLMAATVEALERLAASTSGVHGRRVMIEAELLRAALDLRRAVDLDHRHSISGRGDDLEELRRAIQVAAARCERLQAEGVLGGSYARELDRLRARVEAPGPRTPIDGPFDYSDDMAYGGRSQRDADRIEGYYVGQYGLGLQPRRSGHIRYTFRAAPGRRFARAELHRLVFHGSETRIEVQVDGERRTFSENIDHNDMQLSYDLTALVRGSERFTLVFWARSLEDRPILCLDNWGIRGETR